MPQNLDEKKRTIRSFVIRSGRMTDSQRKAFDGHMKKWSLDFIGETDSDSKLYNFSTIYGNDNPVTLEIGFGMGDSLIQMALNSPDENFLGIEVHQAGVGRLLRLVEDKGIQNIRVVCHDAVEILKNHIHLESLDRINIFFPDPWHKKKHHKRRLIQSDFLTLLHSRLKQKGLLHIATDWAPYAEHILESVSENKLFSPFSEQDFVDGSEFGRPKTKFEKRGINLGHEVFDMVYTPQPRATH